MSMGNRLSRLETITGREGEPCPGGITVLLVYCEGQPKPQIPADARACSLCGKQHVLIEKLVVVDAPKASEER
jgi:hypothetical protein